MSHAHDTGAAPATTSSGAGPGLPRVLFVVVLAAAAWLAVTGLQQLADIVGPVLLTLNLIIVAYPIQARLTRFGVPRIFGAIVTGVIVFAILVAFFAALGWSVAMLVQEIPGYQNQFLQLWYRISGLLAELGIDEGRLLSQVGDQISPTSLISLAQGALSGVTGALSLLAVTVTIIFMTLIDTMTFPRRLRVAGLSQPRVVEALADFAGGVRRYWVVSTIFGLIVAAIDVGVLVYLGVPLAFVWGVLAFLTNYIPNIGFIIGLVPPTLMALLANGPTTALIVAVAYCVINFVIQSIIQPKFNGDAVGVTATVSLLSLLFWAWVLGPLGALLALPATLLVKTVLIDIDPRMQWVNAFIASDPDTGAPHVDSATGERWEDSPHDPEGADEPAAAAGRGSGATTWTPREEVGPRDDDDADADEPAGERSD